MSAIFKKSIFVPVPPFWFLEKRKFMLSNLKYLQIFAANQKIITKSIFEKLANFHKYVPTNI